MKLKSLFIILLVLCTGIFMPKNTFALNVFNNVNIDYRFFVDEDESNAGKLKFKLYDKSGALNFDSQYDSNTKQYYFEYNENGFYKETYYSSYYDRNSYWWYSYDYDSMVEAEFRDYVPYIDELYQVNNYGYYHMPGENEFNSFLQQHQLIGFYDDSNGGSTLTFYTYVPLVLENIDTGIKKICFASINVRDVWARDYVHLFFVNNTVKWKEENTTLGDSFLDNVDFMRKTSLDYSDELWEELNNGPIASSEIYTNNINSVNNRYKNKSVSSSQYDVPEETIDDYANSLPVFSFKKQENAKEEDNNKNIVDVITNPKTWNNGMVALIISMIVIVGSCFIFIKRKNSKV